MKVIVVGGGKIGFYLTQTLLEHGHEPVLIEKDPDVCLRVANSLDLPVIQGDGTVLDTLENAGIRDCDALIGVSLSLIHILSVQRMSMAPKFWMEFRFLTMVCFLLMETAPLARQVVTIMGSISGVKPTAMEMPNRNASNQSPRCL